MILARPPPAPPAASLSFAAAPLYFGYASGGGQTWRRVRGWCFALLEGRAESEDKPPAPSALPPKFGGLLGEDLGAEVRVGTFMKLIADLEASWRKTPTQKKPPVRPTPGGSAEGTGGLSHALLDPQQAPCEPKTAQPTPGLPPSRDRRSRYRGAADDRQGGPRGVRLDIQAKDELGASFDKLFGRLPAEDPLLEASWEVWWCFAACGVDVDASHLA